MDEQEGENTTNVASHTTEEANTDITATTATTTTTTTTTPTVVLHDDISFAQSRLPFDEAILDTTLHPLHTAPATTPVTATAANNTTTTTSAAVSSGSGNILTAESEFDDNAVFNRIAESADPSNPEKFEEMIRFLQIRKKEKERQQQKIRNKTKNKKQKTKNKKQNLKFKN